MKLEAAALRAGQKVLCIRREPWLQVAGPDDYDGPLPVFGETYSLRAAGKRPDGHHYVTLEEFGPDFAFRSINFQP